MLNLYQFIAHNLAHIEWLVVFHKHQFYYSRCCLSYAKSFLYNPPSVFKIFTRCWASRVHRVVVELIVECNYIQFCYDFFDCRFSFLSLNYFRPVIRKDSLDVRTIIDLTKLAQNQVRFRLLHLLLVLDEAVVCVAAVLCCKWKQLFIAYYIFWDGTYFLLNLRSKARKLSQF